MDKDLPLHICELICSYLTVQDFFNYLQTCKLVKQQCYLTKFKSKFDLFVNIKRSKSMDNRINQSDNSRILICDRDNILHTLIKNDDGIWEIVINDPIITSQTYLNQRPIKVLRNYYLDDQDKLYVRSRSNGRSALTKKNVHNFCYVPGLIIEYDRPKDAIFMIIHGGFVEALYEMKSIQLISSILKVPEQIQGRTVNIAYCFNVMCAVLDTGEIFSWKYQPNTNTIIIVDSPFKDNKYLYISDNLNVLSDGTLEIYNQHIDDISMI